MNDRVLFKELDPDINPEESNIFRELFADIFACIDQLLKAAKPLKQVSIALAGESS